VYLKKPVFKFTLLLAEDFWNYGYGVTFTSDIENTRASNKLAGKKYVTA
jgi:hypothetical protein